MGEGQLTGALRKCPSATVLLDEFEKAHARAIPDVFLGAVRTHLSNHIDAFYTMLCCGMPCCAMASKPSLPGQTEVVQTIATKESRCSTANISYWDMCVVVIDLDSV